MKIIIIITYFFPKVMISAWLCDFLISIKWSKKEMFDFMKITGLAERNVQSTLNRIEKSIFWYFSKYFLFRPNYYLKIILKGNI